MLPEATPRVSSMPDFIVLRHISKAYTNPADQKGTCVQVLDRFDLAVRKGELLTLFGPNGCGKTTILLLIASLLKPDDGEIRIDGKAPEEARIGFVFQNFWDSLFPWRKNLDNICFPLEVRGFPKKQRYAMAERFLEKLDVEIPLTAYPYQLSGGQQQLVAIARGLIYEPDVMLMDEPFAALDYQTRLSMHEKLLDIWRKTNTTIVFVSHEIDEAAYLADRMVLLSDKPASTIKVIESTLPRPRTREMVNTETFFKMKGEALSVFMELIER